MSMGYVIYGVPPSELLDVIRSDEHISVSDGDGGYDIIYRHFDMAKYSLRKRVGLSRAINIPPDAIQQGGGTARIVLMHTDDQDDCWFWANAVSVTHPEVVLDHIVDLLEAAGVDAYWLSENDDGYWPDGEDDVPPIDNSY